MWQTLLQMPVLLPLYLCIVYYNRGQPEKSLWGAQTSEQDTRFNNTSPQLGSTEFLCKEELAQEDTWYFLPPVHIVLKRERC